MLLIVRIFTGVLLLFVGGILAFCILIATGDSSGGGPIFYRSDGSSTLLCFTEDNLLRLSIEFRDEGHVALLRTPQGKEARLTFKGGWLEDVYSDGAVEIRIDPEVYLTGIYPAPIRPCDWE
jgi:hypothetical protein